MVSDLLRAQMETPTIYLCAIPTGTGSGMVHGSRPGGDVIGYALAEDGTGLVNHLSSSVAFAKYDMGLTSNWKHDIYHLHYSQGFRLEWVDEPKTHRGYLEALAKNRARHAALQEQWSE